MSGHDSEIAFAKAFLSTKQVFDQLSAKQRLELLKSIGGLYGHRVLPGTGGGPSGAPAAVKAAPGAKRQSQPKSQKSAKQIETQKKIQELNSRIASTSKEVGNRLPENHPLLVERQSLFRVLRENKDTDKFGAEPQTAEKTSAGGKTTSEATSPKGKAASPKGK
jgi:regulator of replication initiation timing